jgi:hypothetical protein
MGAMPLSGSTRRQLLTVSLALLANAFAMSNPFPYSPFMAVHLGVVQDLDSAGFASGMIMSAL